MPYVRSRGGLCPLCSKRVATLEKHHVSYNPEKTINICHKCHFKIHHFPDRLDQRVKILLNNLI